MTKRLMALGQFGDRRGPVWPWKQVWSRRRLAAVPQALDSGSLAINYDPANLFINGFDPYEPVRTLQKRIAQVHAKDARRATSNRSAAEVGLGYGDLDDCAWPTCSARSSIAAGWWWRGKAASALPVTSRQA